MYEQPLRLSALAEQLGCKLEGDGGLEITGVAALESAGPGDLAFVRSRRYLAQAQASGAGAIITPPDLDLGDRPLLRSTAPHLDFARATDLIVRPPRPKPGVHATAVIDPEAEVDASASIGPYCTVGARSQIGAGCVLHPRVALYEDVVLGPDCTLHAGVVLRENVRIGARVLMHPGVVVGADGFGYAQDAEGMPFKIPQVGTVVIEDDVEIGANATIDRAALGETRIRRHAKIDDLCMISHNCDVGEGAVIAGQSGLSGSVIVERGAFLMGQTGVVDHVRIGERAFLGARAGVAFDVPAHRALFGYPLLERRKHHRVNTLIARLPELFRRVKKLEGDDESSGGDA